jgi:hypothetical protein
MTQQISDVDLNALAVDLNALAQVLSGLRAVFEAVGYEVVETGEHLRVEVTVPSKRQEGRTIADDTYDDIVEDNARLARSMSIEIGDVTANARNVSPNLVEQHLRRASTAGLLRATFALTHRMHEAERDADLREQRGLLEAEILRRAGGAPHNIVCPTCEGAGCYHGNGEPCSICAESGWVSVTYLGPAPAPERQIKKRGLHSARLDFLPGYRERVEAMRRDDALEAAEDATWD